MMSWLKVCLDVLIVVLLLPVGCQAVKVFIYVDKEPRQTQKRSAQFVNTLGGTLDSCTDTTEVSNPSAIHFSARYRNVPRPWVRNDLEAKLYKSDALSYNWSWMRSLTVRGLASVTVDDVLYKLELHGCMFVAWGGAVRDAILGRNPTDIDGEVTCTAEKVRYICIRTFGLSNCGVPLRNNFTRTVIGNHKSSLRHNGLVADPMDVSEWNATFAVSPIHWEFTANSIGLYDDHKGNVYLLDLTGRGVHHVCAHQIDIVVNKGQWDEWVGGDLIKLLRYYKLRLHGFIPASSDLKRFIVNSVQHYFSVQKMQHFYCQYVLDGSFVWTGAKLRESTTMDNGHFTSTCLVAPIDAQTASDIYVVNRLLESDFGEFYDDEMRRAVSMMERRVLANESEASSQTERNAAMSVEEEMLNESADDEKRERAVIREKVNVSSSPIESKEPDVVRSPNRENMMEGFFRDPYFRIISEDETLLNDSINERLLTDARLLESRDEVPSKHAMSSAVPHCAAVLLHVSLLVVCVFLQ